MRQKLDNTIQELIYRETNLFRNQKSPNNKTGFIGWGNLFLKNLYLDELMILVQNNILSNQSNILGQKGVNTSNS